MDLFEGTEKKLEVTVKENKSFSFFDFGEAFFEDIVSSADAEIISVKDNGVCRAYLLSESSMFVYPKKIVMITCGRTRLANSLVRLIKEIGIDKIDTLFYERKNHLFPERQPYMFEEDMEYVSNYAEVTEYCFGDKGDNHVHLLCNNGKVEFPNEDMTLEILMHNINFAEIELFYKENESNRGLLYEKLRMEKLLGGFGLDDYFFEPCGYSFNAIKGGEYATCHVTPQEVSSYASFETNKLFSSKEDVDRFVNSVIDIFKPKSFDILLFQTKDKIKDIAVTSSGLLQKYSGNYALISGINVLYRSYAKRGAYEPV